MNKKDQLLTGVSWSLGLAVVFLAIFVWLDGLNGRYSNLSVYQIFPLLGLVAFSLMWTHYFMGAVRRALGFTDKHLLSRYFEITSFVVLLAIFLHPGLLVFQLWEDGFGLPPGSVYEGYVAPAAKWAATLGVVSWGIFIAYEFHRKFGERKWWRFVGYASDAAMIAIFIHALRLGTHLEGWYLAVWWFYGLTLLVAIPYRNLADHKLAPTLKSSDNKAIRGGGND